MHKKVDRDPLFISLFLYKNPAGENEIGLKGTGPR